MKLSKADSANISLPMQLQLTHENSIITYLQSLAQTIAFCSMV